MRPYSSSLFDISPKPNQQTNFWVRWIREERESRFGLTLLSRHNLSNAVAHYCNYQDFRVPIYNISLPHRRLTSKIGLTHLCLGFRFAIFGLWSSALVLPNNHHFSNRGTPIFRYAPIQQPNDIRSVSTSCTCIWEYILLWVYKTLRSKLINIKEKKGTNNLSQNKSSA